jgi:hypothetical protein
MILKSWLAGLAGAVTIPLALVTLPAAAPAGGINVLQGAVAPKADIQQATWYGRDYGYHYGYRPYYRYGYGDYGYRPGFRYYYGPRYHRRHWHYRHW